MSDDLLCRAARRLRETSGDADTWTWLTATAKAVTAISDRDPDVHQSHHGRAPELAVPEPTSLHDRIIDIIETEWLRPFDPHDSAGDTPGARAYDAARHVEEAVLDELDRRAANTCKARDARIAELVKERDGLLYTLQHIQATLDRWGRPYAPGHAHNCVHAVAELQNLLNPQEETDA